MLKFSETRTEETTNLTGGKFGDKKKPFGSRKNTIELDSFKKQVNLVANSKLNERSARTLNLSKEKLQRL